MTAFMQQKIDIDLGTKGQLPPIRLLPGVAGQCLVTDGVTTFFGACSGTNAGTVTSFSAGNLSPLFTTSVATQTTTPALSFSLSTVLSHKFLGNNTGATGAPAYVSITSADLPAPFAVSIANGLHQWVDSYDSTTGLFTQTQPAYTDLTGLPTLAANTSSTLHQFFTAYNSTTGAFTKAQPDYSDLTSPPQLAITKAAVASNWIRGYDSVTGLFAASQPAYTDLTGTPTLPATLANSLHKWLNSYNSVTGLFTQTQPDYGDLTGTPQLPLNTTATASNFFTAYNSTTGAFTKATIGNGDLPGAGGLTIGTTSPLGGGGAVALGGSLTLTCSGCLTSVTGHNLLSATHPDTTVHTVVRGDLIAGIGVVPSWTAVAKGGTNAYPKWNSSGDVIASTGAASGIGACPANQFETTDNADAAPTCAQPAYSGVTGTPQLPITKAAVASNWLRSYDSTTGLFTASQPAYSDITGTPTLRYQTVQDEGTGIAQEPIINFIGTGVTCVDNSGATRTDCTITSGGSTPTGTGFTHITAGVQDSASKTVDVSSADITGVLKASAFPALTGDVTTSAGALVTTLSTVATPGTSPKVTFNAKGLVTSGTTLVSGDIPNNAANTSGNAGTATALDHNPADCSAGNYATGIDATGAATGCTPASGGGTVTEIDTTSPITGGPITTTGTIACATCTTSTTPGAGVAHFAGGTQDMTSSAVTSADTTGTFPATAHSILSATHSDTTAAALVRGDGLFAVGATPTLQRVAHGGTGTYFKWNGTDVVASTQAASGVGTVAVPCSNQFITSITTNADALPTTLCATVTRASEAADAKGWAFCGTATGAATTVGPVSAATCCSGGTCREFHIHYIIKGYNGGTPVGRLLMGAGTPSTTALTNSASLREVSSASATDVATATVSIPGIPLAVTLTAIARDGWILIDGASGDFKSIRVIGMNGNPSVSAAPSIFDAAGWFSNLSTNLPLQQFQLTVYDTLTATAASSQTFLTGTALWVWGRNGD